MAKGIIQVYTGEGKGKTTAALGQALRASGWGRSVGFYQFLKGPETGEMHQADLVGWDMRQFATGRWFIDRAPDEKERSLVREGFRVARRALGELDLVVLDEVSHVLNLGLIAIPEFLEILDGRSLSTDVILTGRNMPPVILEHADLVTEMKAVKHPYDKGVEASRGREY